MYKRDGKDKEAKTYYKKLKKEAKRGDKVHELAREHMEDL